MLLKQNQRLNQLSYPLTSSGQSNELPGSFELLRYIAPNILEQLLC